MRNFNFAAYQALMDIDDIKKEKSYNKSVLPLLGNIICKYNLQNYIGIILVHRHFSILDTERMVSDYNIEKREWISVAKSTPEQNLIPINWKVIHNSQDDKGSLSPIDFVCNEEKFSDEKKLVETIENNKDFIDEIITLIMTKKVGNIFGVGLLMNRFNVSTGDEVMFETNYKDTRTSHSFFVNKAVLKNPDAITQWHFYNSNENSLLEVGTQKWCDHL